jgi:hypothetical protein
MPDRYATPKRWSTVLARFLILMDSVDFAASYLKAARNSFVA